MKKVYPLSLVANPLTVLRKAGYAPFKDPLTGEESFIVRLTAEFYPRFHLYVEQKGEQVSFNLHLDQKKASYGEGHMHAGEYDGSTVEKEMARIDGWVHAVATEPLVPSELPKSDTRPEKQSWISKLLSKMLHTEDK
jgi:hypothetical protein